MSRVRRISWEGTKEELDALLEEEGADGRGEREGAEPSRWEWVCRSSFSYSLPWYYWATTLIGGICMGW